MKQGLCLLMMLLSVNIVLSQVGVGTADPQAALEVSSSTNGGFLVPQYALTGNNDVATVVNPSGMALVAGTLVYNTSAVTGANALAAGFVYWNGSTWSEVTPAGGGGSGWELTGNAVTATDFLGTTNFESIYFQANNTQIGQLHPSGGVSWGLGAAANDNDGIAIGNGATSNQSAVAIGSSAINTGNESVALGNGSNSNFQSVAIGLNSINTGTISTAIGVAASSANNSIALGNAATTSGVESVALGNSASAAFRGIAIGLNAVASANDAIAIGQNASGTSQNQIAIGLNATATGNSSLAIGDSSSASANATAVGNTATASGSNSTAYGRDAVASANNSVAIGRTAQATANNSTALGRQASAGFTNSTAIGRQATTTANNQVVIGNTNVTQIGGFANWTNLSDGRFKLNVKRDVPGLAFISKIEPVTYNIDSKKIAAFKNEKDFQPGDRGMETGFIAQQVEAVAKELGYEFNGVHRPENMTTDHYTISYATFVVPLVKAVQEQQAQIDALKKLLESQQKEIEEIKALLKSK